MSILEHRQSTRREGIGTLVIAAVTVAGLIAIQVLLFEYAFLDGWQENKFFLVGFYGILALVTAVIVAYGVANIVKNQEFICRVDGEAIECISPVKACGESFRLPLAEIAKIEVKTGSDSAEFYLYDRAGSRYQLTTNYGNPGRKIIETILKLNPAVAHVET
jgi:hypothetical protein